MAEFAMAQESKEKLVIHRPTASLYLTLLQAVGRPRERFGVADPGLCDVAQNGPL